MYQRRKEQPFSNAYGSNTWWKDLLNDSWGQYKTYQYEISFGERNCQRTQFDDDSIINYQQETKAPSEKAFVVIRIQLWLFLIDSLQREIAATIDISAPSKNRPPNRCAIVYNLQSLTKRFKQEIVFLVYEFSEKDGPVYSEGVSLQVGGWFYHIAQTGGKENIVYIETFLLVQFITYICQKGL